MIKYSERPLFLAILLVASEGCDHRAGAPPGYQGVIEHDERVLSAEVGARVVAVPVKRGDVLQAGQSVARLDDSLARLTRQARADEEAAARAELALLEAGAKREDLGSMGADVAAVAATEEIAKKNVDRARSLHESGSIARAELDRAMADMDRATAQKRALELRLRSAQVGARPQEIARAKARLEAVRSVLSLEDEVLARYQLTTKTDGLVLDVHVKPGELAPVGTPVATIADVTHPYVDVFVPVGSLDALRVGTRADVQVDATQRLTRGEIEFISPKTEFTPRYLFSDRERPHLVTRVRVRVDDKDRTLHAGVPAFVRFTP